MENLSQVIALDFETAISMWRINKPTCPIEKMFEDFSRALGGDIRNALKLFTVQQIVADRVNALEPTLFLPIELRKGSLRQAVSDDMEMPRMNIGGHECGGPITGRWFESRAYGKKGLKS